MHLNHKVNVVLGFTMFFQSHTPSTIPSENGSGKGTQNKGELKQVGKRHDFFYPFTKVYTGEKLICNITGPKISY